MPKRYSRYDRIYILGLGWQLTCFSSSQISAVLLSIPCLLPKTSRKFFRLPVSMSAGITAPTCSSYLRQPWSFVRYARLPTWHGSWSLQTAASSTSFQWCCTIISGAPCQTLPRGQWWDPWIGFPMMDDDRQSTPTIRSKLVFIDFTGFTASSEYNC